MNANEQTILSLIPTNDDSIKNTYIFDDIIGQTEVKTKLKFFVDSHLPLTPIPTLLFTGSQGLGKSFMASKVARALDRDFVEINCGSVFTIKDFIENVILGKILGDRNKTVLFDEAHQLSSELTTALLTLLNPNSSHINMYSYKNWLIEYDLNKINVIFATTDAHKIFKPLLNRCTEVYFDLYSNDDLFDILQSYLPNISLICDKDDISYACRGRARDAYMLSQNILRYCNMTNKNEFDDSDWVALKDIFGVHSYGLYTKEVELIKMIKVNQPISCNNLAIKMGVNVENIESEIELRPKELGFITNTVRGRCLTEFGLKFILTK